MISSNPIRSAFDSQDFSFGGPDGPAEGPLWWIDPNEKYGGHLLFSDIHNDRRMRFTVDIECLLE